MIVIVVLQNTLNPISAAERVKINQNWDAIRLAFSSVQNQISFLSGGEEIDGIINRINTTLENANTEIQNAVNNLNSALDSKLTDVDNAVESYNAMIQSAVDNLNQSLNAKISEVNLALVDLNNEISNSQISTAAAIEATTNANQAVTSANDAISRINETISRFVNRGVWNTSTLYYTNNIVYHQGQTYIARQDNTNRIPTNTIFWTLFAERGQKGDKGDKGDVGAALSIQGSLTNVSQLPATGQAGQAYTVNGVLYVWSENTSSWENVGNIKGERGEKGDKGDRGDPGIDGTNGSDANVTNANVIAAIGYTPTNNANFTAHTSVKATTTQLGHVMVDGTTITIDGNGKISGANTYTLPTATTSVLGGIKPDGSSIVVNPGTGVASAVVSDLPEASLTEKGIVRLSSSLSLNSNELAATASTVRTLDLLKATKAQEDFVTTPSQNGWVSVQPVRYYKDSIGNVHVTCFISSGTKTKGTTIFTMPTGYRPARVTYFVAYTENSSGSTSKILQIIEDNGAFKINNDAFDNIFIDISFRS